MEASEGEESDQLEIKRNLRQFTGTWAYDPKLTKAGGVQSATAEKIMKKARVPLTKRLGLQYFVGKDVSQTISLDRTYKTFTIEAFIKGISTWKKQLHLDSARHDVVDYLFGKATSHSYFNPTTRELFYVLDAKKSEKGRLAFVRTVPDESRMILSIRWYPNPSDETLYISHYRVYSRKEKPNLSDPELDLRPKKEIRYCQTELNHRNSMLESESETAQMAIPRNNSTGNIPMQKAASLPQSFVHNIKRQLTSNSGEIENQAKSLLTHESPKPVPVQPLKVSSGADVRTVPPQQIVNQPPLWRSLVLPISAFIVAIIICFVAIKFS